MAIKTISVTNKNLDKLTDEIYNGIKQRGTRLVLYFASTCYDFNKLSELMAAKFPKCEVIGCTTAGEITSGAGMCDNSVTAVSIGYYQLEKVHTYVQNLAELNSCEENFRSFVNSFIDNSQAGKYVGINMVDGLSQKEEELMDKLGNAVPGLIVVGGSAADDGKFQGTKVAYNGKVMSYTAVIPVLKMRADFKIIQTTNYKPTNTSFKVTKADPQKRIINKINGKPAGDYYKSVVKADDYGQLSSVFATNPIGMTVDEGDPFVRSLTEIKEDGSIQLYCAVEEGSVMNLLSPVDIVEDTRKVFKETKKELGRISGGLLFSCLFRKVELLTLGKTDKFNELIKGYNLAGFTTYGEQYIAHMNQTLTGLIIK